MRIAANAMHQSFTAREQSDFGLLMTGSSVSMLDSRIATIAFPVLVLHLREFVGPVAFATTAPSVVVYIRPGRCVDCGDPLWIMLVSEFGLGIAVGALVTPVAIHEECRPLPILAMPVRRRNQQVLSTPTLAMAAYPTFKKKEGAGCSWWRL